MIRIRIACLAALLAASLPAWAGFGFQPLQTFYHPGDGYQPYDLGQRQAVMVRDVNDDGLADVLLVHYLGSRSGSNLLVFLQDPTTHALRAPETHPIDPWASAHSIDAVDLDNDGIPEIVVGNLYGASVLSPAQGFAVTALIDRQADLNTARSGDFDGDGAMDVLLLSGTELDKQAWLYRGDGAGHFDPGREVLAFSGPLCCLTDMRAVDFNGDGSLDAAMLMLPQAPFLGGYDRFTGIWAYANNGDGTFKTTNGAYPDVWRPYQSIGGLDAGDLDGDGKPELVAGLWQGISDTAVNGIRAYFHGAAGKPYLYFRNWRGSDGEYTTAIRVRDMDGDGRMDIVFAENTTSNVDSEGKPICYIEYVPGAGKNVFRTRHSCSLGPDSMAVGDINGDGLQDVVVADPYLGFGWTLGTNSEPIVNLVVGEGLSTGAAAFNLENGSTSATIAAPSVEITYSVNHGKIDLADWPQQCSRPDPQALRIVCNYPDLPAGQSASGIVHYTVLQSQPYMQLHADAKATTTTEETVTTDNAVTAAFWIRQL